MVQSWKYPMGLKRQKLPRSSSSLRIGRAVARLVKMPLADRIQLMVKAKLITQEQADQAKLRVVESGDPSASLEVAPGMDN